MAKPIITKLTEKRTELARLEERIRSDTTHARKLDAEVKALESKAVMQQILESELSVDDVIAMLSVARYERDHPNEEPSVSSQKTEVNHENAHHS